jgi:excisionase family DNA binding protein
MKLEGIQTTLRDLRNEHAPVEAKEQPEQRYYRPEEMAMVLGVPRGRIISWIRSRRIRGEKIGGSWMIPKTQYEAYVKPNDAI